MGRVCSVKKTKQTNKQTNKKNKKNAWSAIDYYLVLFSFAYVSREMGSNKEMKLKLFQ